MRPRPRPQPQPSAHPGPPRPSNESADDAIDHPRCPEHVVLSRRKPNHAPQLSADKTDFPNRVAPSGTPRSRHIIPLPDYHHQCSRPHEAATLGADPGAGVAVGAASFALPLFVLLPFGRPRGRLTGWPSALGTGPSSAARFVAAFTFSVCRRSSLR